MESFIKSVKSFFVHHKKEKENSSITLPFIQKKPSETNQGQQQPQDSVKTVGSSNDGICCEVRFVIGDMPELLLEKVGFFL